VTGFWSETDGLIERVTLGRVGAAGGFIEPCGSVGRNGTCSQRRNIGKTRAQGVELDGEYRPQSRWRIDLAAVLLDAEVVENPAAPELVGNEIEQTPSERVTLGVSYADPRTISVALRGRMVGDRFAEVENENPLDAHTVVDLTLTRPLSDRIDIFGGAENLLDEEFATNFGSGIYRYGLRRTFQIGVRYRSF
jgi:vitamin B12 transporter